jgi:hypothetical protein
MAIVLYVVAVVVIVGGFAAAGFAPTEFMGAREAFYAKLFLALPALLIGLLLAGLAAVVSVLQRLELQGREIIELLVGRSATNLAGAEAAAPIPATAEVGRPPAQPTAEPIVAPSLMPTRTMPASAPIARAAPTSVAFPADTGTRMDFTTTGPRPTSDGSPKPRGWRERIGLGPAAVGVGALAGAATTRVVLPELGRAAPEPGQTDAVDKASEPPPAERRLWLAETVDDPKSLSELNRPGPVESSSADAVTTQGNAEPELRLEDLLPSSAETETDRAAALGHDILTEALSEPDVPSEPEADTATPSEASPPPTEPLPEVQASSGLVSESVVEEPEAEAPSINLPAAPQLTMPQPAPTRVPTVAELLQRDLINQEADAEPMPRIVREGQFAGRRYRMFENGSLEIDTEQSTIRFASLDEFRAFVASASRKTTGGSTAA